MLLCAIVVMLAASDLRAQGGPPPDVAAMSIEELLRVPVVTTASKFPQDLREAPASMTVVTAADIRRYGHRSLAAVLRSVRGLYTTYDRNYDYIGIRGFARPGDYNTRVLLLVDGHRLNDPIYDMAPIGTDFPVDVSLIDRIEVIRGPASSLYGTNAVFGVINIVTRTGAQHAGVQADSYAGSLGTRGGTASFGKLFRGGSELLLAGSVRRSAGVARLHFPEFDGEVPGSGIAADVDADDSTGLFGSFSRGVMALRGAAAERSKQVPTGSYGTVFGDRRTETWDERAYLTADFDGTVGRGWSGLLRLGYDYYHYDAEYPTDYGLAEPVIWYDGATSQTAGAEATLRRRAGAHLVTVGAEVRANFENHQYGHDDVGGSTDVEATGTHRAAYVQDEFRVRPWLLVSAGLRVDGSSNFTAHATPRAAVVLLPRQRTSVKLLHGRAFRAPNSYELNYYEAMRSNGLTLEHENVHSTELIWEEFWGTRVRSTVSAFAYRAHAIIEQRSTQDWDLYFTNASEVDGTGVEVEVEAAMPGGLRARWSHAYVRTESGSGSWVSNSPRHLATVAVEAPISRLLLGIEGQYVGERLALDGEPVASAFVPNLTLASPAGHRLDLSVSVYNVFDTRYANPGGEEHVQRSIAQDGRTVLARARVRF